MVKTLQSACVGLLSLLLSTQLAHSSSFQVFSGYAYSNPASLMFIQDYQVSMGVLTVLQDIEFRGTSAGMAGIADSDEMLWFPTGRIAKRLSDDWVVGVDVSRPFNSHIDYLPDSVVRFIGTQSRLQVTNIAPQVAYKMTDNLSIGAGVDSQYLNAELDSVVAPVPALGIPREAPFVNQGDSWGWGWHVGLVYHWAKGTFVSLTHYSPISHHVQGTSHYLFASPSETSSMIVDAALPPTTILEVIQYMNPHWVLRGTFSYTNWNELSEIRLQNTALTNSAFAAFPPLSTNNGNVLIPLHYKDTWRVALGTRYDWDEHWSWLGSVSYDRSPSNIRDMSVRAPDNDIRTIYVGIHYTFDEHVSIEGGYARSFVKDARITNVTNTGIASDGTAKLRDDSFDLTITIKG